MKPATTSRNAQNILRALRVTRLQAFLSGHDITFADIAEQLSSVDGKQCGEEMEPSQARTMLFRNLTMSRTHRECLLDLGFPHNVLPPERTAS